MPLHLEHIIPLAKGGTSVEENLWMACALCNGHKATKTEGLDAESDDVVSLFNPRTQKWADHFQWVENGLLIDGRTPVGRVTVDALHLNNQHLTRARRRWILAGWHPPEI